MRTVSSIAALMLILAATLVPCTQAQNNRFTDRSFVSFPSVRAMGDAGVALPGRDRLFFQNPAQLPHVSSHFTVAGVQAAATPGLDNFIRFFNDRVEPAINSEFEMSSEELRALYRETSAFARQPARGDGVVTLPSFAYTSDVIGVGGGLFAKTALNYRVENGQSEVPEVYLLSRTDVMALASLGFNFRWLGLDALSLGVTATRTQRFLAFKNKPLNEFKPEEPAVLLSGDTFQLDVGMLYSPTWWGLPGQLSLGGAAYDVLDEDYAYTPGGTPDRLPFLEGIASHSANSGSDVSSREMRQARQEFELERSFRVGLAYRLSSLLFLDDVNLVLDYQRYGKERQTPWAHLYGGVEARLGSPLFLRAGVGGGYPAGGVGVQFGVLQLDYAYYGLEEERAPGFRASYVHSARLTFRFR